MLKNEKSANRIEHQNRKTDIFWHKNRKPDQKNIQTAKPKIAMPPPNSSLTTVNIFHNSFCSEFPCNLCTKHNIHCSPMGHSCCLCLGTHLVKKERNNNLSVNLFVSQFNFKLKLTKLKDTKKWTSLTLHAETALLTVLIHIIRMSSFTVSLRGPIRTVPVFISVATT